jgi:molybdate transport system substrate-binding protein
LSKRLAIVLILVLVVSMGAYVTFYSYRNEKESTKQRPTELRVFVAASMAKVTKEHQETFEKDNNARIIFNVGGSDSLYQQITSGSPADVYMAADFKWTKKLQADGFLYNNEYWNFTTNVLVVILPTDNPANVSDLSQLARPGTRIVVAAWTVPAGKYTNVTLTKIESTWGNKSNPNYKGEEWIDFRENVVSNIISYETNVESVVAKVSMGICDAGFVYVSDASSNTELRSIAIPDEVNTKGTYGIGVISSSTQSELAIRYVNFWISSEGQQLLTDYGFGANNLMRVYHNDWTGLSAQYRFTYSGAEIQTVGASDIAQNQLVLHHKASN